MISMYLFSSFIGGLKMICIFSAFEFRIDPFGGGQQDFFDRQPQFIPVFQPKKGFVERIRVHGFADGVHLPGLPEEENGNCVTGYAPGGNGVTLAGLSSNTIGWSARFEASEIIETFAS